MKNGTTIFIVGLAFICAIISCKKNREQTQSEKLQEISRQFIKEQLHQPFDSIQIQKLDTLTQMGYAKLTLEMLENLYNHYQLDYFNALSAENNELVGDMQLYMMQTEELKSHFGVIVDNETVDNEKPFLYMFEVNMWHNGVVTKIILFATLQYAIYDLDPFNDNLLEKNREKNDIN